MSNNIITGKMKLNEDFKVIVLNQRQLNDTDEFHIKKTNEVVNTLKDRKNYINRITFMNVNSYNSGECSFIYDNDDVYFTIYNIEHSLDSLYQKKGVTINYSIKDKEFNFDTQDEKNYIEENFHNTYDLKMAILDEIDALLCNSVNEIYLKKSIIDNSKKNHIVEIKGNYESKYYIKLFLYDITKEENLINKAFQAEKLQALGNMSGAIAHELNNQLMAIDGNIELALKSLRIKNNIYLSNALDASKKSSDLIKSLVSFSNNDITSLTDISFQDIIDDLSSKIKLMINHNYQFLQNIDLDPSKIHLKANSKLLGQALINIIQNSIESFNKQNNVLVMNVKTTYLNSLPDNAVNTIKHVNGKYLEIDFIDNGSGISYTDTKKIFDPFFSTKNNVNNTGLGLTQTLGTVIKHEGILTISSVENVGTTISIFLKCKEEKAQLEFDFDYKKRKIMLIDDEEIVRLVLEGLIKEIGFESISFSDGYEAISFYNSHFNEIDLVISDMIMPKINGKDLFYRLLDINPYIKFILLSGYTKNNLDEDFIKKINCYLEKPIRKKDLETEIEKCLK